MSFCVLSAIFRGFTPAPGTDIMNPGLVADGTRCGDGRVRQTSSWDYLAYSTVYVHVGEEFVDFSIHRLATHNSVWQ